MSEIAHIYWRDSTFEMGWMSEVPDRTCLCESVGFVMQEDEDKVVLACSRSKDFDSHSGIISIPRVAIASMDLYELGD